MELGNHASVAIPVYISFDFVIMLTGVPSRSYEKELDCGTRPALRLITAQDVSTGLHMILVSRESSGQKEGLAMMAYRSYPILLSSSQMVCTACGHG
jgi:hypothetical protein